MAKYVRNKQDKITGILDATKKLIEQTGYADVTIRDIASESDVSVGLIYKYFPDGKPEIVREIGLRFVGELTSAGKPDAIDFDDFPGFLGAFFQKNLVYYKNNTRFLSALTIATMMDRKIFEGFEGIAEDSLKQVVAFFGSFKGVKFPENEEPWLFIAKWSDVTKSIMLHHAIYPTPFKSDEEVVELLVNISLMMWGFKKD